MAEKPFTDRFVQQSHSIVEVYKLENSSFRTFITFFVAFLTNFWFQDLFKERIREACLINFLTYRLNFEIFKSK
ncbi:hypothetical protein [Acinetobacter baumannii]|uniref:hypothetical protein n=2 Tax=Acinetobacter baumannii TaxID=470 RepID=UPI00069B1A3F|nr:hypothetical protein [Acinetobacter baumannii]KOA01405.1 hypothetical protein RP83_20525 [Acinetobacter baumannii]KOA01583.1 hypothetical protein RP80_20065 [Acinetobacter baumannii]